MSTEAAFDDLTLFGSLAVANRALAADLKSDPATMARGLDLTYRMRPHLRVIGTAMAGVLVGDYDRLLIITPPQVGKSTLVAEWGPFWWLANRPADDIVIASYAADLAEDRSKGVRRHIAEYGDQYDLYTLPGSEAAHDWELTCGGHLRAVGVAGGLSGFPANLIIVDDPHADRAQAESETKRKAVHDWWSSTASKRLQPDMGAVICIMTRWHPDDFAGRRLKEEGRRDEGGRWQVVHLPALADPRFGIDPLGRAPGEPLTHPKIPTRDRERLLAWWHEMRRTSIVRDWHSLGQGDPQPTKGALVKAELLEAIRDSTTEVAPQKIAVGVDPSGGGRDTAGIVGGFLGEDNRLWITDDETGVMSSADWSRKACLLAYRTDAAIIFVEANYGGDMAVLAIRTAWVSLQHEKAIPWDKLPPMVKAVHAKVNKLLRAEPIAQQMILDRVRLRQIFPDLEHEWQTWQSTDKASPGRIDASCVLAYGVLPVPPAGTGTGGMPTGQLPTTDASPLGQGRGGQGQSQWGTTSGLSPLGG